MRAFKQRLEESLFKLQAVQEEHEAEAQAEEEEAHTSSAHAGGGLEGQSNFHNFFGKGDQVANLELAAKSARAASGGSGGGGGGGGGGNDDDADDQLWSRFGLANTASRSSTFPSDHSRSPAVQGSALTRTTDGLRDEIFARWPLDFTLDISDLTEQCDGDMNIISDILAESVTQGANSIDCLEEAARSGDTEQLSCHAVSPPLSPTHLSPPHTPGCEFCARTSLRLGPTSIELCPAESPSAISLRPAG